MEEENCHFVYKHLWSPTKARWVPRLGSVPGEKTVLELNLSNRGEIFRLKAWSNEGATVCWGVSAQDQIVNLCACQRISLSGEIPPVFMVLFVVSKCFKVSTKAFMRPSGDITCCLAISVENQRAAVRIWEFLFSSLHWYVKVTALRKTFLYLGLYQEKCQEQ